ncbi:MAG: MFS transporter, partial [Acidobacteria bacterium]|nr:MFS transporter [Acidobacteriota bacterium]
IPLLAITIIATAGMPALIQSVTKKIDFSGIATVAVASTTLILGLSFAGTTYPWGSVEVIGLLSVSALFWILFLKAESKAEEPILDLKVLRNRIFLTASGAGFLSFFAITAMMVYYPLMLQGMQGVSATNSGYIVMPLGLLMSFFGVPVGFLISRTKRYKWMYLVSYALLAATMSGMVFYDSSTPLIWGILAAIIGGIGFGSIPTINTLVIQCAIPKRLLGVAMGALFFSISMGVAIAPAILGSAMNIQYNKTLKATLPAGLDQSSDEATMTSLGNPRVLLSDSAMASLKERLAPIGLLDETVQSIRSSMDAGLKAVFLIGALAMLAALLLILTIPEIPIDRVADE